MTKHFKTLGLFISSLLLFIVFSFPNISYGKTIYPNPTSYKYINDYVGIVDRNTTEKIVSIGKEVETKTGAQATIVIIDSTGNVPIEDYANKLFRTWGIGQSGKDNGLLILMSLNDKRWRVEVGRGLEGAIPDVLSNQIMESLAKPHFAEGNYGEGLLQAYSTFSDEIGKEYNVTIEKSLNIQLPSNEPSSSRNFGGYIGIGALILILLDVFLNRGRIITTLLQIFFLTGIGRGGRGGGSSGGGGFGGFGGGSSNGGGSSGGW